MKLMWLHKNTHTQQSLEDQKGCIQAVKKGDVVKENCGRARLVDQLLEIGSGILRTKLFSSNIFQYKKKKQRK